MFSRIYFDHNATGQIRPIAREAFSSALGVLGNPSAVHQEGRKARAVLEESRKTIAYFLGVSPEQIVFTSGGTEANYLALQGVHSDRFFLSAIEHPCVRETILRLGKSWKEIPVSAQGIVDLSVLENFLQNGPGQACISVMHANNETGAVQPIPEIAALVHAYGGIVHVDAAQSLGRIPVRFAALGADVLTFSAHKMGGPLGVGGVVFSPALSLQPSFVGGKQENRLRAGTENFPAIFAFSKILEEPFQEEAQRLKVLRDDLEKNLRGLFQDIVFFSQEVQRLPNTSCFALPGFPSEMAVIALDLAQVSVSAGAACASGKISVSKVLDAMGVSESLAMCAIRVSLGWSSTQEEVRRFIDILKEVRPYGRS